MKEPKTTPKIRWPKIKSRAELRAMTKRQAFRYALRLHEVSAEKERQSMEWDLYWCWFYRKCLNEAAKPPEESET